MPSPRVPDFSQWVTARGDALARTAFLLTADASLAEDLVQVALIRVYRRWDRLDHTADLEPYVRTVLLHCWRSWWRRSLRRETAVDAVPDAVADDAIAKRMLRLDLVRALQQLPVRQRAAVVLRYFDDLSEADTADALGCSVGTVKSQTSRGLDKLRVLMSDGLVTTTKEPT